MDKVKSSSKQRKRAVSTRVFWTVVVYAICGVLFLYVVTTDMQEHFNLYINGYMKPGRKYYVCPDLKGNLPEILFKYAFAFGVATSNNRSVSVNKDAVILKLFELSSAKILKNTGACSDLFQKRLKPVCCSYNKTVIKMEHGKHYTFVNGTGFVSYKYFDRHKSELKHDLQFKDDVKSNANNLKSHIVQKYLANTHRANAHIVVIYLAKLSNLHQTFGPNFKELTSKFVHMAVDYFQTRLENIVFIVYSEDTVFAKDVMTYKDVTKVFVNDVVILQPETRLAFLASFNHVVTTGVADMLGWWVGYLSSGDVVYPVMGNSTENRNWSNEDVYPHGWISLVL